MSDLRIAAALVAALLMYGVMANAQAGELRVGDKAPEFTALADGEKEMSLSDYTVKGPVVLVFSRAHWCPFCMGHMRALQQSYDQIKEAGAEVVVVFREERDGAEGVMKSRRASSATFPMLVDKNAAATPDYSTSGFAAYIVDGDGVIQAILPGTKKNRPDTKKILDSVKSL
ncbi:peroxiredoxin family protein [Calycomorphotria hydatis]|uniref:Thiol-disulfide oxidoreductase ResA n=1 Tax=Calycomorphotria hydatis TaxID=2528027 RepID=A0A517TF34_9PLAN|nr:peroxiredoxin family protein [Calycomorphotria hydatis]QDT66979.1 Thiol-disulfide oxidoreductase ResA [Calycomorphotria hydatis]